MSISLTSSEQLDLSMPNASSRILIIDDFTKKCVSYDVLLGSQNYFAYCAIFTHCTI
jgi:hypothetical protein